MIIYISIILIILYLLFNISKKSLFTRKIFIVTSITLGLVYIYWRISQTLIFNNILSIIFGSILIICEIIGLFQSSIFKMLFWNKYKIEHKPIKEYPTVDIFIATYNEPIKILEKTIICCNKIEYPKHLVKIHLCDDKKRVEAKELCDKYGIDHITRNSNEHAKAGNLNSALKQTCGEIIMTLDADMIPRSNFLERTIGYFENENVGFVQSPQVFYNPDPFQYNLNVMGVIPNEQDLFMRTIEGGRALYNATLHVGTNALFRRSALEEIGGIPVGSITEDMATGMLLQAKGYKSIFVNESLAYGLSAENFSDFMTQRDRWAKGNIQVAKKWNPLKIKGLTIQQRLIYFDGVLYWFNGIFKLIFILAPLLYVLFGISILNANIQDLVVYFLPYYVSCYLSFKLFSNGGSILLTNIYETATAPRLSMAVLSEVFLKDSMKFKVTPKGEIEGKSKFLWKIALPHIILLTLNVIALIICIIKFSPYNLINIVWITYNTFSILMSIFVSFDRPRYRKFERFLVEKDVRLYMKGDNEIIDGKLLDISDGGARIAFNKNNYLKDLDKNNILIINIENLGEYKCKIIRITNLKRPHMELCIEFIDVSQEKYENIINFIFNGGYTNLKIGYDMKNKISIPIIFIKSLFNFTKLIFNK